MARVYAWTYHRYEHFEPRVTYIFPAGEVRVVPDDIARRLCAEHPTKLKLLREHQAPPKTPPGEPEAAESQMYENAAMAEPVADRQMRTRWRGRGKRA